MESANQDQGRTAGAQKLSKTAAAQLALVDAGQIPGLSSAVAENVKESPAAPSTELSSEHYVRAKLFAGDRSNLRRYIDLMLGEDAGVWALVKFELMTMLLGGVRGALGLQLRQWFYPRLFKSCGKGVVFGRDLVIRHGKHITLGDGVVIDDQCELDAHGAGSEGVVIGDQTIINRDVSIKGKIGPVHIGRECDIGMRCDLHSQGGLFIGNHVVFGGGTKISGGIFQIDRSEGKENSRTADTREQKRTTSGPIRIGAKTIVGMRATFLDGVQVGEGCIIGACSLVNKDLPAYCVAAGTPARVLRDRPHHEEVTLT